MKTIEEIKSHILEQNQDAGEALMIQMSSGHPLAIYVPEMIKEEYQDDVKAVTRENIIADMKDYMEFAWTKAYGCRGISASRSLWKYQQWLWLLEDEELLAFSEDDDNYAMYAVPILRKICEEYEFIDPHPDYTYKGDEVWGDW